LTPFMPETPLGRWSVCAGPQGDVWIAKRTGDIYQVSRGTTRFSLHDVGDAYSLACGQSGFAWFVVPAGIHAVHSDRATPVPAIAGLRPYQIMQAIAASDHTLYATVSGTPANGGGIWR